MKLQEARAIRKQMEQVFEKAASNMTGNEVIENRLLCKAWREGSHQSGEVYKADGQIWQCIQDYDNAVYPDICPENAAWRTFNKPYHGTTAEAAMPWAEPTGAHDIYQTGEYMIWTDGITYRCISATAYSPADYAQAWQSCT